MNLMGNIQSLLHPERSRLCVPPRYLCATSLKAAGFTEITSGLTTKNVFLRQSQFRLATEEWFALRLARKLVAGKIRNQRVMLMRNHEEPPKLVLEQMWEMAERAEESTSL